MSLAERIQNTRMTPGKLGAKRFRQGTTSATTTGERSRLAKIEAPAARGLLDGRDNPLRLAIPAYEQFSSDGTGGNSETLNLSHSLIESKNTNDVVVYINGQRTSPDAVDYQNDTVDVTDPGSNNNIHVWYTTDATGELELVKAAPSGKSNSSITLDSAALHHVARQDQSDQPHYLSLDVPHEGWVPEDFSLEIYVNAEFQVALTDPAGDGATADNLLYQIPARKANDSIPGLKGAIRQAMQ